MTEANLASQAGKREPAGSASGEQGRSVVGMGQGNCPPGTVLFVSIQNILFLFLHIFFF